MFKTYVLVLMGGDRSMSWEIDLCLPEASSSVLFQAREEEEEDGTGGLGVGWGGKRRRRRRRARTDMARR